MVYSYLLVCLNKECDVFRWVWLLAVPVLYGCASMQVSSDYDAGVDFSALHSYDWLPPPGFESGDAEIRQGSDIEARIKKLVGEQLEHKGYERDTGQPDFLVSYHIAVEDKTSVTYANELYGYGPGWSTGYRRNVHRYPGTTAAVVSEYQQGTLLLDVVKSDDMQLIWRGTATAEVTPGLDQEAREKRLREAVQEILAQFPPPAK